MLVSQTPRLQIQHMFAEETTVDELRENIQRYTRLGGDHGHTNKYIRKAMDFQTRSPLVLI